MDWIGAILRYTHVAFGFAALAAFWLPILSRKGGPAHVRYGRIFVRCAWVVLATAGFAVVFNILRLALSGYSPLELPAIYAFLVFLGYLAFVTWVTLRHAYGLMCFKGDPSAMNTGRNHVIARLTMLSSPFLVGFALWLWPPNVAILLALSPVGYFTGRAMLRYISQPPSSPRDWLTAHLGGMIGAGIAFHTAFAVFGARQLFDLRYDGWTGVLPWILPTAIGIPAIAVISRHYRRRGAPVPAAGG